LSTKIYTGFIFKTMDFFKIHREIMKFRAAAREIAIRKNATVIAAMASYQIDRRVYNFPHEIPTGSNPLGWAAEQVRKMQHEIKKTMERNPCVDLSFNLSILPIPGKILGIYYTEDDELAKLWMSNPLVEDYHSQNQCDQPKEIGNKEWKHRARDWDKALPGPGIPAHNGFTAEVIEVAGVEYLEGYRRADKYVPSLKVRATKIARDLLYDQMRDKDTKDIHEIIRDYTKFVDWMTNLPEGKKALADVVKTVSKKLARRLTKKILCEVYK
jgi:hypothetical protein